LAGPNTPEGYPYITVRHLSTGYAPTLVDWHSNGYEQDSGQKEPWDTYHDAKRSAVDWAKRLHVPFKRSIS
jgi:hypothetical protein